MSPDLCRRCGICCMLTIEVNGRPVAIPDLACKYLRRDGPGRYACTVYEDRFCVAPWCLTVEKAREQNVLARDCPYRLHKNVGPQVLHPRLLRRIKAELVSALESAPLPPWLDTGDFKKFCNNA